MDLSQDFNSTYLVEWEVLSKLQVACLCCFIFQPQIGFLLSIFATFLVLISDLLQRPSKTTQRFAIAACYCILSPKRILLSPFARSPPSPTSTVSSWVSKAKMREKLTTLQYWRYQLYTQKSWAEFVKETDKNAEMLDAWHLQYVQSVLRNKHVNEVRKYSSALCDKHLF